MLGGMRKVLDKHQKTLLVILAVLLIGGWTILSNAPRDRGGSGDDRSIGTLYGTTRTVAEYEGFVGRWRRLDLPFVRINPRDRNENPPFNTFLILHAARRHGIRVGPDAVTKRLHEDPPMRVRIEYVLADPAALAKSIKPSEADLKAYYDTDWKDKSKTFEEVKDRIRGEVAGARAKQAASERIEQARKMIAEAPRGRDSWKDACSAAAAQTGLDFAMAPPSSKMLAPYALRPLGSPLLPDGLVDTIFRSRAGEPSKVWTSGDKRFIFRVIAVSAGIAPDGTLFPYDEGWRNGQFMTVKTYPDYESVVKEKRRMDLALARRAFEEHLTVQKFLALVLGDASGPALTSRDAREQLAALQSQEVKAQLLHVPVAPFVDAAAADEERVRAFYDARKAQPPNPLSPSFGYSRPEQIQVEYVIAGLDRFKGQVALAEDDITTYYERNKAREFVGDDGKTLKPLKDVRADIVEKLTDLRARSLAAALLKDVKQKAQAKNGQPLPMAKAAAGAGLASGKSQFFSRAPREIWSAAPELAGSTEFADLAFSQNMRPFPRRIARDVQINVHPLSPPLVSHDKMFVFRVLEYLRPRAVSFDKLPPVEQQQVRRDYAHTLAVQKATGAARKIKVGVARALVAAIAAENKLAVKTAGVKPVGAAADATTVPPALVEHVTQKLQSARGGIARLIQDGDTYYTAAITAADEKTYEVKIDYIRFTAEEFTAAIRPSKNEIDTRARTIRDTALKENDGEKPEPTEEQVKQAGAELIAEWKKGDFRSRYVTYLNRRLTEVFREHVEANPLEIDRVVRLRQITSSFFHADDTSPLGGDPVLIEAAFKLKPLQLSGVITGKSAAAIMLLDREETRDERKAEFVSVNPKDDGLPPFTVTDADATKYYNAHPDEFRRPAQARAEFAFASFDAVADVVAPSVTPEEIEAYYKEHASTAYVERLLDERLRGTIRRLLARKRAEETAAEQAVGATHRVAAAGSLSLAQAVAAVGRLGLVSGTTPRLSAENGLIPTIGFDPDLVTKIVAAEADKLNEPVRTGGGWVVFRVTEKQASVLPELKDVLPAARAAARKERLSARAAAALEKVRAFLAKNPKATIKAALARPELAAGLPFDLAAQTAGFFDKEHATGYPQMTSLLSDAIFSAKPGQTTAVVKTGEGVQLARVIEAKTNRVIAVHYVRIGADLFAPKIRIPDADAEAYYAAHKADYARPKRYELECLFPDVMKIQADIKPSDADIAEAYVQVQDQFRNRKSPGGYLSLDVVRGRIVDLLKTRRGKREAEKLAGKALELLAKDAKRPFKEIIDELKNLRPEPVATYEPGGKDTPSSLRAVAGLDAFLATAQPGAVSPVLRASAGPILVRVKKILPAGTTPFDDVKERIKKNLAVSRGLIDARKRAEQVRAKIVKPTAAGLQAAAAQFPVETVHVERLKVEDPGYISRKMLENYHRRIVDAARRGAGPSGMIFRLAAYGSLFSLRPGEVSELAVAGDRADTCSLAVLAGARHEPAGPNAAPGSPLGWAARAARLKGLLNWIRTDFVDAPGAR